MSWDIVKLGEITDKVDYGVTASAIDRSEGVRFLRITDLQDDAVDWEQVPSCDCSEKEINEWADKVIHSMTNSDRATPRHDLFDKIQVRLNQDITITLSPLRIAISAAAAVVLLALNVSAIQHMNGKSTNDRDQIELYEYTLISDYKI